MQQNILYLTDKNGNLKAVQISVDLWNQLKPLLSKTRNSASPEPVGNDMEAFEQFIQYWDFSYPYSPSLACPKCHTSTSDWRNDPEKPFVLANANFGGLLVFHCITCGAIIKQMHFKDHVATEIQA